MKFCFTIPADRKFFCLLACLGFWFMGLQSYAQSGSSLSPYSRYGIGDILNNGFTKNLGMGGTGIAQRPNFNINIANPASYSALSLTSFDFGISTWFTKMSTTSLSQKKSETTFSYFALGFPVINQKWGAALGLVPYSNVGYKIVSSAADSIAGDINYTYEGTGGVNRVFIGNAVNVAKNFSAGFNASYLFGSLERVGRAQFEGNNFFNSRFTSNTIIRDFYFDFGLQYTFDSLKLDKSDSVRMYDVQKANLKDSIKALTLIAETISAGKNWDSAGKQLQLDGIAKNISELNSQILQVDSAQKHVLITRKKSDWSLTFGLTGAAPTNLSASQDSLIELYQGTGNFITVRDTLLETEGEKGTVRLPLTVGFGATLKKGTRWLIAADVSWQNWEDFSFFGQDDSLRNGFRASTGMQYTPNDRGIKSYWQMVQYRLGAFYNQTYLQLKGSKLDEYGITAGLGLPIKRGLTMIHLSAMLGTRGTTDNNLIKEDIVRVSLGITFSDRWFIKTKYE